MNGLFFVLSVLPKIFTVLGKVSEALHEAGWDSKLVHMEEALTKLKTASTKEEKSDALDEILSKTNRFFS